jgi:hypothetical protein
MTRNRSNSSVKRKSHKKSRRRSRKSARKKSRKKSRIRSRKSARIRSRKSARKKSRKKSRRSRGGVGRVADLRQVDRHLRSRLPDLPADQINLMVLQDQIGFHIQALKTYGDTRAQTGHELTSEDKTIVRSHVRSAKNLAHALQKQKVLNVGSYHNLTSYLNTLEMQALQSATQGKLARRTMYMNNAF